ncbi:glycerol kinase 3-like [Argopecten irradians]|uniref:glycerol kinase 3-like n=1 Tax=Argopecten irradians TaxID=31199 RepID=UPI0037225D95
MFSGQDMETFEKYGHLVGSIDQGSSSTRFSVFSSKTGEMLAYHQEESVIFSPSERAVEMDPKWILESTRDCMLKTAEKMENLGIHINDVKCIGITNQMLTLILWDRVTGQPVCNAIVYSDSRGHDRHQKYERNLSKEECSKFQKETGMPLTSLFLPIKLPWLLENIPEVKEAFDQGRLLTGTVNTWFLWSLTGGPDGGVYVTDVTNACHTGLMNLNTFTWDEHICSVFNVPTSVLPAIHSTSEIYGCIQDGPFKGIPLSGMIGDQPSATTGQLCFKPGESKCTYGTVASLNINTGTKIVSSSHGLLTSPLYQLGKGSPSVYMLEAVVASGGCVIKWIRDNLGMIETASEIEELAGSVQDTDDCYFVPAFEGFFCPYWTDDARGVICGLNSNTTKAHICRAALESICFQVRKVLEIAAEESGFPIPSLRADGGMAVNSFFMQMQADILGGIVVRPFMKETTSFGAALMAGAASGIDVFRINADSLGLEVEFPQKYDTFENSCSVEALEKRLKRWEKAVQKSFDWMKD